MRKPQDFKEYQPLMDSILLIEKELNVSIDCTNGEEVNYHLNKLRELMHITGKLIENATLIYEQAKGDVAETILENDKILNTKQNIVSKFIEGKMSEHTALYARAERCYKMLDKNIEALRSILSFNKTVEFKTN